MEGISAICPEADVFTQEDNSPLVQSMEYKFVYKSKIKKGILIGKGTKSDCKDIVNILTNCQKRVSKKSSESGCLDVFFNLI